MSVGMSSAYHISDAVSGCAGWANLEFQLTLFQPRGQIITACPPRFEILKSSLHMYVSKQKAKPCAFYT